MVSLAWKSGGFFLVKCNAEAEIKAKLLPVLPQKNPEVKALLDKQMSKFIGDTYFCIYVIEVPKNLFAFPENATIWNLASPSFDYQKWPLWPI